MLTFDLDKLESETKEQDLLKIFSTMSFNGGNVKETKLIDSDTIYLTMFNEPDMIFHFKSMNNWSLQTAFNYVRGIPNGQDNNIHV